MPSERVKKQIEQNRKFVKYEEDFFLDPEAEIQSDQQMQLPMPPLAKATMTSNAMDLPYDFESLEIKSDFLAIVNQRVSHRLFTEQGMNLLQLSYLLWTTQGVKSIRGNNYATFRTVPSGGARHEFETYVLVHRVEGLSEGVYHYLPMTHQIEKIAELGDWNQSVEEALVGQKWATKADCVFFWSCVPYRSEWRYSFYAHRVILMDIGYISQNLYLACESIGLGTCAIGAFDPKRCDQLLQIDGEEEFMILASPVGIVDSSKNPSYDYYSYSKQSRLH